MVMVHWRRKLRDGGVEYFFRAGITSMTGAAVPDGEAMVNSVQALFEHQTGVTLPKPEWKPSRTKAA